MIYMVTVFNSGVLQECWLIIRNGNIVLLTNAIYILAAPQFESSFYCFNIISLYEYNILLEKHSLDYLV